MNEPAMTPEEWEDAKFLSIAGVLDFYGSHAVAAAALDGQPFGFTRERLEALARVIFAAMSMATATKADIESARSDYNRIEALLPPEKP